MECKSNATIQHKRNFEQESAIQQRNNGQFPKIYYKKNQTKNKFLLKPQFVFFGIFLTNLEEPLGVLPDWSKKNQISLTDEMSHFRLVVLTRHDKQPGETTDLHLPPTQQRTTHLQRKRDTSRHLYSTTHRCFFFVSFQKRCLVKKTKWKIRPDLCNNTQQSN